MDPLISTSENLGLSTEEAQRRLQKFGNNEIVGESQYSGFKQFLKILRDPMGLMMLGLSILYFLTDSRTDAVIILIAYIPVTMVDVFLELRSEKALKLLKSNFQTKAKVFRDGHLVEVPVKSLVPGDILAFAEGQSLPADGQITESSHLSVNESALTGESLPVEKTAFSQFYAGTTILSGRGLGQIQSTGRSTKFGKISHLLESSSESESPLQKKVNSLVKKVVIIAFILVLCLLALELIRGATPLKALITALTFGMATVPEEFPLVFTLYLSLGAWRLSKKGVLVKSLPSVETLGNVDVICTDKTGTLTEGKFSLIDFIGFGDRDEQNRNLVALMACEPQPVDAMELAITNKISGFDSMTKNWKLSFDYPFEASGKHMTHIWTDAHGNSVLAMKGAVEGILEHVQVMPAEKQLILETVNRFSSQGKRILGLAAKNGKFSGNRKRDEENSEFVGLLIFSDPVRPTAKMAITECQKAGIEIKMLTGDHLMTAHAIGHELEIFHQDDLVFSGSQIQAMTEQQREQIYLNASIFARVSPEQKFEMIQCLQKNGKVVAMTGDGINDSPALKLADIGVSMGESATDVARSTAKMVLLKNDFNALVAAIIEGRNIFSNLRRSFSYLISFHIPVVFLAFFPPLIGWSQLLLPIHIILLELIVHPISAFAFENLNAPFKRSEKSLLPLNASLTAILSGCLLSVLSLAPLIFFKNSAPTLTRSISLSIVLYGNIGFTLLEAWPKINTKRILFICGFLLLLPAVLCNLPGLNEQFSLSPLSSQYIIITFLAGIFASLPALIIRNFITK